MAVDKKDYDVERAGLSPPQGETPPLADGEPRTAAPFVRTPDDSASGDSADGSDGSPEAPRRRKRAGLRVPSDNVPRPQATARYDAVRVPDADVEVDIDLSVDDESLAAGSNRMRTDEAVPPDPIAAGTPSPPQDVRRARTDVGEPPVMAEPEQVPAVAPSRPDTQPSLPAILAHSGEAPAPVIDSVQLHEDDLVEERGEPTHVGPPPEAVPDSPAAAVPVVALGSASPRPTTVPPPVPGAASTSSQSLAALSSPPVPATPAPPVVEAAAAIAPASNPPRLEDAEELSPSDMVEVENTPAPVRTPPSPPPSVPRSSAQDLKSLRPSTPLPVPTPAAAPAPPPPLESATPKPKKRRGKAWFEDIFDDDYLRTLPFLTPQSTQREASFIVDGLGLKPGMQLLDVGCGYGRHAMELAARGFQVVGLDLSLPLLIRGADEAQRRGLTINFVHGDMRELSFDSQFDGAYCLFSTFGYFDDETNRRVAQSVAKALRPGAKLMIEVLNRDYVISDLPTRVWWEGDGCVVLEEVEFNYFTSRLVSNRSVVFEDGRQLEQELSIRVYSLHELGKLLHQAGFRVTEVSGGMATRGRFFGKDSRQLLVVAEKRPPEPGKDSEPSGNALSHSG